MILSAFVIPAFYSTLSKMATVRLIYPASILRLDTKTSICYTNAMENYELTVVLPGKSKTKEKSATEKVEKLVKVFEGKVTKKEVWGEIDLSYKIRKESSGFFLFFNLELSAKGAKNLFEKLRLEDDFLRYLLIKEEGAKKESAK
jgi:small subunit ribosomal protein S6